MSTRLIASNVAQCFVSIYILPAGIALVSYASKQFDDGQHNEYWTNITQTILPAPLNQSVMQKYALEITQVVTEFSQTARNATAIGCSRIT